jgi:phosphohistidine phosphatase
MKRLILIRHAKSGWDDLEADDHERTLTRRGHAAAKAIGAWLAEKGYIPDVILSSDAARTLQTAAETTPSLPNAQLIALPMLYLPAPDTIWDLAQRRAEDTVAVISHNPGTGMLAQALVKSRPKHHRFSDYPTCATTIIDFPHGLGFGMGHCTDFIVPRDLTD